MSDTNRLNSQCSNIEKVRPPPQHESGRTCEIKKVCVEKSSRVLALDKNDRTHLREYENEYSMKNSTTGAIAGESSRQHAQETYINYHATTNLTHNIAVCEMTDLLYS